MFFLCVWERGGGHTCHMWKVWVQLCGVGSVLLPLIAFWGLNWHCEAFVVSIAIHLNHVTSMIPSIFITPKEWVSRPLWLYCFIFISFSFSNDLAKQNLSSPFKNQGSERHTTCQTNKQGHTNYHTTVLKKTWCYCCITHGGVKNNQSLSWVKLWRNMPTHAKGLQEAWLVIQNFVPS